MVKGSKQRPRWRVLKGRAGRPQGDLFAAPVKRRRPPGARRVGRPWKGTRAGSPHKTREEFKATEPVHVVLRVHGDVGSLRKGKLFAAIRSASAVAAKWEACRIVHASVQQTHIHLIVEAENKAALARGMKAFQISAAKHINATISRGLPVRRRGAVFPDRYHAEVIRSPRQARHTLAYVLNNWRKHREDQRPFARTWTLDPYSTAVMFGGWKGRGPILWLDTLPPNYVGLFAWLPRTWLLTAGWRRHGLLSMDEVPGPRPRASPRRATAPSGQAVDGRRAPTPRPR